MEEFLYKFPVKGLENGYGYFTSVEWHQDVVFIHAKKFFDDWIKEEILRNNCKSREQLTEKYNFNARFMSGDDNPISPHYTEFEYATSRLNKHYSDKKSPFEIPLVAYSNSQVALKQNNTIRFVNGRHRLINHFCAGACIIPVQLTFIDGATSFKEKYGAEDVSEIIITRWEEDRFGMYPKLKI